MKVKIVYLRQVLIIDAKNNKLINATGPQILKEKIVPLFKKAIYVHTNTDSSTDIIAPDRNISKKISPGKEDFIIAVLIERVKNELGASFEILEEE